MPLLPFCKSVNSMITFLKCMFLTLHVSEIKICTSWHVLLFHFMVFSFYMVFTLSEKNVNVKKFTLLHLHLHYFWVKKHYDDPLLGHF